MYQASELFNTAILGNKRTFRAKIKSGSTEITTGIRSIKQYRRSVSNDYFSIGGAASSYIEVEMWKPDISLENTEIEVSIGMALEDGIEYVPLGMFTVQKPTEDDGVVKFVAYDRIQSRMSGAYFSELTYPADGKDVLSEISSKTGVQIDTSNLPDGVMLQEHVVSEEADVNDAGEQVVNITYVKPFDGYTYREAIGYIAQLYGKFATADRNGAVVFRWYSDVDYTVPTSRYYNDLVTNEQVFTVNAIACMAGEKELISGTGTANIQIQNPVMTQERLDAIYQSIKDMQFLPAGCSFLGDMRLDLGDIIKVKDKSGNIVRIPLMSITQDFDGGLLTEVQSFGRTDQEIGYQSPSERKFEQLYTDLFKVKELVGNKASFELAYDLSLSVKGHTEQINYQTGQIESISNRASSLEISTAEIKQTVSETRLEISGTQARVEAVETQASQTADKFNWIVKSGTSATDFTLTDRTAQLITESLVIKDSTGASTIISGGKMDIEKIFAQDITATGTIRGVNLIGSKIVSESDANGIVTINNGAITVEDPNYPDSGVVNIQSAYICSSVNYTGVGKVKAYFSKGGFHIYQEDTGGVTVYAGHMDYNYISLSKNNVPFFKANETGIYEGNTLLADKYAAKTHTHSYLPLSGGTLTGNLSVSHSDTTESRVYVSNSAHSGKLLASSSGNFGLYDDTNSKWVVQSNSAGTVTLNGNATTATTLANARTLTIGNTGKSFNGSANVAWTLEEIGAVAATNGSPVWTIKDGTVKATLRKAGASPSIGLSLVVTDASNNNTFYGLINSDGTCAWIPRTGGTLTGNLYTYAIYDNTGYTTTTSNANYCCYVTSATNSNYHRIARYASSSRRYKNRISEEFDATTDYRNLLRLPVVTYHYNNGYITEDPAGEKKHIGFIVEDLDSLFPAACGYDEQGRPENWNAMEMIPGMLKLIQDQHEDTMVCKSRITSAEARMESLQYQLSQMLETINDQRGIIAFLSAKVERLEGLLQAAS